MSRKVLEGVGIRWQRHSRKLYPSKQYIFAIGKHVEDAKQVKKHVPDPSESIILTPTGPVKEELRQKIMNMNQFRYNTTICRVSTFLMTGKSTDSHQRPMPAFWLVSGKQEQLPKHQ